MSIPLPPDPYKALGVESTAPEGDIRKAYTKLALKCHPDKIQDPNLRAQKTEEFHKIQKAWELLSDKTKRGDYDEKVKTSARNARSGDNSPQRRSIYQDDSPPQYSSGNATGYQSRRPPATQYQDFEEASHADIYTAEPGSSTSGSRPAPRRPAFQEDDYRSPPQAHIYTAEPRRGTSASAPPPRPSAFQQDDSRYPPQPIIYTAEPRSEFLPQEQYRSGGLSFEERKRLVAEARGASGQSYVKVEIVDIISGNSGKRSSTKGDSKKGSSTKGDWEIATSGKHKGCLVRKTHKPKEK